MTEPESSRDIDQAASDWTARLDRGLLSPKEEQAFQAWLTGDPRRRGALLRAQAVSLMSESARALGPAFDPAAFEDPKPEGLPRRRVLAWAAGAAGVASLAALGLPAAAGVVVSTRRGEVRLAPLKDGSTVLLNTESRIRVRYDRGQRVVVLLKGEAYFSVVRDDQRPFVVEVDGRRLRTAQAGFRVRKLPSAAVDVLVDRGEVEVAPSRRAGAVAVAANMRLALDNRPMTDHPHPVAPEAVSRELAWREGKLAFEGETLRQAADAFARYSDTRIEIRDPALAREPVTGLFAANDPVGFSRAIARVFDARFEQSGDGMILSRRSPTAAAAQ